MKLYRANYDDCYYVAETMEGAINLHRELEHCEPKCMEVVSENVFYKMEDLICLD